LRPFGVRQHMTRTMFSPCIHAIFLLGFFQRSHAVDEGHSYQGSFTPEPRPKAHNHHWQLAGELPHAGIWRPRSAMSRVWAACHDAEWHFVMCKLLRVHMSRHATFSYQEHPRSASCRAYSSG
jgi:hypothetical protein